jgi:hypothetical protein
VAFQQFVEVAADEIKGDFQTFAAAYVDASVGVDRHELEKATKNIAAWLDENGK